MKNNKEISIDELANMIAKGFDEIGERIVSGVEKSDKRFDKIEKELKLIKLEVEDVKLILDNVAYRFELEAVKRMFGERLRAIEIKMGIKYKAA